MAKQPTEEELRRLADRIDAQTYHELREQLILRERAQKSADKDQEGK